MSRRLLFVFVVFGSITLFAQENKIQFDFFATNGYLARNSKFLLRSNEEWKDYLSSLGGDVTYSGGKFGKSQYEFSLRYVTNFSQSNYSRIILNQLYIQTPLTDYTFLTVGKRVKKFGLAAFHNFSNRLSPKERVLGQIERLERIAPGLIQFDWIATPHISLGTFLWSYNTEKWKDINIGAQTEIDLGNVYGSIHLYYEKLKDWFVGINISDQMGSFRIYGEGIIKEKNEQYFPMILKFKNRNKTQFSFSGGIAWEWRYYSARCEYAFRSEGYNKVEKNEIKGLVQNSRDYLNYYHKSYFGENYVGFSLGAYPFIIPSLGFSLDNLISFEPIGGELDVNISYLHKEAVAFGVNFLYYYGKNDNEYMLYLPYQYRISAFVTFSY